MRNWAMRWMMARAATARDLAFRDLSGFCQQQGDDDGIFSERQAMHSADSLSSAVDFFLDLSDLGDLSI